MSLTFQSVWWQISVPLPWRARDSEHCVEITQPKGAGALHISAARKNTGIISQHETLSQLKGDCPEYIEPEQVRCGDFEGFSVDYVNWNESAYWKKWFVASENTLLFISYTCKQGEENLEVEQVEALLSSLRYK